MKLKWEEDFDEKFKEAGDSFVKIKTFIRKLLEDERKKTAIESWKDA